MSRATRPRDRTLFAFTSRASLNMSQATTRPLAELDIDDPDLTDEELDALLTKLAEEEAAERLGADDEDDEDDDSSKSASMGTLIAAVVGTVLLAASTFIVRKLRRKKAPPPANVPSDEPTILQAPGTSNNVVRRKKPVKKKVVKKKTADKKACAHCGATEAKTASGKLLRCGRCKAVSFCSADCQKAHWPTHKSECKPAEAPAPAAPAAAPAAATAPALNAAAPAFVPPGSSTPAAPAAPAADGNPANAPGADEPPSAAADPDADDAARRAALQERINNDRENMRKLQQLRIYLQAASQMFWRGEYRRAVEVLQQVAEKCHGIPSGEMMECEALRLCGHCLIRLKQFDAADRCLDMCMDVAKTVEMPALIANVHIAQGQLASQREPPDYPEALKHHEAARVIARECEDISAEAAACLNCANTMGKMGDKERGMELQYEALGLRRKQVADAQLEIAEAKKILDENPPASTDVPEGATTQEQAAAAAADPTQVKRRRAMMDLANSKRSLQEARRAEAAALANVATAVAGADGDKASRATDAAALYEQSIEILRSEDSFTDKQLELAVVLNLANVYDNHVPNGHGTGVEYRRELDEMVRKNVQGKEGLPDVCGVCEERTNPLDMVRTSERGVDEDADDMTALTVLDCMHCHHSKCWTARKETGKGCPDCHRDEPDGNAFV